MQLCLPLWQCDTLKMLRLLWGTQRGDSATQAEQLCQQRLRSCRPVLLPLLPEDRKASIHPLDPHSIPQAPAPISHLLLTPAHQAWSLGQPGSQAYLRAAASSNAFDSRRSRRGAR